MKSQAGKGDTPRQVDPKVYGENYDRIFRKGIGIKSISEIMEDSGSGEKFDDLVGQRARELEAIRDSSFNCKWPKPRFDWENKK